MDETQLVNSARQGDQQAFETLVRLHERYVYNLALRVVGNPEDAQDLAQQAFIRAWKALPGFRGECRFGTWLYRIVTNQCYDRLPRIRRDLAALLPDEEALDLADERQEPESEMADQLLRSAIQTAFNALPASYRLLVTLRHLQGMSYEEIARVTGVPLGTVKTGIFRARRLLRESIEQLEAQYE